MTQSCAEGCYEGLRQAAGRDQESQHILTTPVGISANPASAACDLWEMSQNTAEADRNVSGREWVCFVTMPSYSRPQLAVQTKLAWNSEVWLDSRFYPLVLSLEFG